MRNSLSTFLLLALLRAAGALGGEAPLPPQPPMRVSFKAYGPKQGLTSLSPRTILQTRDGYLWVGTENGVFRYDGVRFQVFGKAEGLPSPFINALHEAADGSLWVGTERGAARRSGERFEPIGPGLPEGAVVDLATGPGGQVIVAT